MSENHSQNWLVASWKGHMPLSRMFWRYAVPINLTFFSSGAVVGYLAKDYPKVTYAIFLVGPLIVVFTVWLCVSLWRCAFNSSWWGWAYFARFWSLLVAGGLFMQLRRVALLWA